MDAAFAEWNAARRKATRNEKWARKLRWVNFGLLLGVVLAAIYLFQRHLEHFAAQTFVVGIPFTLWGLFEGFRSLVPSGPLADDKRSLVDRILRHPSALFLLFGALVALVIAICTTSSLYVSYDSTKASDAAAISAVEVQVKSGGQTFRDNLLVTPGEPVAGTPYFLSYSWFSQPVTLDLEAVQPFGYRIKPAKARQQLSGDSAVRLTFPDDFEPIDYYICRIIPGAGLQGIQPLLPQDARTKSTPSVYELEIQVDGQKAPPVTMSYDCLYFGASREVVALVRSQEDPAERLTLMKEYLSRVGLKGPDLQDRAEGLARRERWVAAPEPKPGQKIEATVFYNAQKVASGELIVEKRAGIQNLIVGVQ